MLSNDRERLLVKVSRLYYETELTQSKISERLRLSRQKVQRLLIKFVEDSDKLAQWFGCYMTSPKYLDEESAHEEYRLEDVRKHLAAGGKLIRNEGSRFAFQECGQSLLLFVDGRHRRSAFFRAAD